MKTDSLFYELFRRWPALALDLAGLDPALAPGYTFRSEEIKQTAFRLDGIADPPPASDAPWVFVEVQFQPDTRLYPRLFAEIALYLRHATRGREWRALVIYPEWSIERIPLGYAGFVAMPEIHRVDLSQLSGQDRPTPGWELLRILVDEADQAVSRAQQLLGTHANHPDQADLLNFIETLFVYKLPRSSREEIQAMLGITDIDLKQTRFYQEVAAENQQEWLRKGMERGLEKGMEKGLEKGLEKGMEKGLQKGLQEGRQREARNLLQRLAARRFGPLPAALSARVDAAPIEQLEHWLDQLLDAPSLDDLFADRDPSGPAG